MALIIEVLRADDPTVRHRVRVGPSPLSIGRGLDNDVILEDAYVDARHARVRTDEAGNIVIEDLGSVNGLVLARPGAQPGTRAATVVAAGGTEVRLGRTILRFRDPAEPVAPALLDTPAAAVPAAGPLAPFSRRARFGLPLLAAAVIGAQSWLGSYARSSVSDDVLPAMLAFFGLAALWSGIWAIAARIAVGRSAYGSHFAIVAVAALAGVFASEVEAWLTFLHPSTAIWSSVGGVLLLAIVTATLAFHLRLASAMTTARCWRTGVAVSAVILAFGGLAAVIDRDKFSDVPSFSGVLKPVVVRWPAPASIEDFLVSVDGARSKADDLAARMPTRDPARTAEPAPADAGPDADEQAVEPGPD